MQVIIEYGKNCNNCGVSLNTENCAPASMKNKHYKCKKCKSEVDRLYREEAKAGVLAAYGGACACCNEARPEFLTIDHIFSDGNKHRDENGQRIKGYILYIYLKKLGYPKDKYQLMCWNCNRAKFVCAGTCPHKTEFKIESPIVIVSNGKFNQFTYISDNNKLCTKCGVILTNENTHKGSLKNKNYKCNICATAYIKYRNSLLMQEVLHIYGGKCSCCFEKNTCFLNIDHISGDGSSHRESLGISGGAGFYRWLRKNNYPKDNFQILCSNCNCAKQFYGYYPHNKEMNVAT